MKDHDNALALRNGIVVGLSLLGTWSVALLVRLVLPRHLGPTLFGQYSFAEALALTGFGFVGFGLDVYIQKEIPLKLEHASDFWGGTQVVRLAAGAIVVGVIAYIAHDGGYDREVVYTVIGFGLAQLSLYSANTCATLVYAARRVGRLSILNITTKVLWAAAVVGALVWRAHLWAFALAGAASELLRFVVLFVMARQIVGLRVRFDFRATFRVLRASAPYYLNVIAIALYSKIDVAVMGMLLPNRELGFYGAATNISSVAMLLAPLISWVVTPQLARAADDREDLMAMLRRALEWTLVMAIPVSLVLGLAADVIIGTVFGAKFAPAVGAMRVLSPIFVLVYVAMLGSTGMILLNRAWTVTMITLISFVANGLLNVLLVRGALRWLGEGGGGIGAATISVVTEGVVAGTYVVLLGRGVVDRASIGTIVKSLAICAAVVALHVFARPLGPVRLVIDVVAYFALAIATRAIRLRELFDLILSAWRERRAHAAT